MGRKCIKFDNKKIEKIDFYKNKKLLQINDIDVNNILLSKKEPYRKKNVFEHIIGYNDNGVIRPLYWNILQLPAYTKKFKKNDEQLIKNYNKIWEKVERLTSIDFESKPVCGDYDQYIKFYTELWWWWLWCW